MRRIADAQQPPVYQVVSRSSFTSSSFTSSQLVSTSTRSRNHGTASAICRMISSTGPPRAAASVPLAMSVAHCQ
ncbi:hypothetical protein FG87_36860 [Nocardia vulneris]|uniref:Uncharacterized protein n=1 Tax=Nocardia vulneris TaxID=1141657 RepID=A0ABR4Z582_9NOCA|nr:hypothetical protein FG87_36860 [Nocardia vulneris]